MKKAISFLLGLAITHLVNAQIPNNGFENWTSGSPDDWMTSNSQLYQPIVQVTNAHGGGSAMKMQWQANGNVGANATCPDGNNGYYSFPYAGRPAALTGWYISSFGSFDYLKVSCLLYKNSVPIGVANMSITGSQSTYKQFSAPITYSTAGNSDSATITLTLLYNAFVDLNSFALVDDLTFGALPNNGLNDVTKSEHGQLKLLSDPLLNSAVIEFNTTVNGPVKLYLSDLNGKVSKQIVDRVLESGSYRFNETLEDLQSGIYLVVLESQAGTQTKKLCVFKN